MPEQASGNVRLEPSAIVGQVNRQGLPRRDSHCQRVVGLFDSAYAGDLERPVLRVEARVNGIILKHQETLEERLAGRHVAPSRDLDQGCRFLPSQLHLLGLQLFQPGDEGSVAAFELYAHRQAVDEEPHHSLYAGQGGRASETVIPKTTSRSPL